MMYSTYGKICGLHISARRIVTVTVAWFRIVVLPYARMICQQWLHMRCALPVCMRMPPCAGMLLLGSIVAPVCVALSERAEYGRNWVLALSLPG